MVFAVVVRPTSRCSTEAFFISFKYYNLPDEFKSSTVAADTTYKFLPIGLPQVGR